MLGTTKMAIRIRLPTSQVLNGSTLFARAITQTASYSYSTEATSTSSDTSTFPASSSEISQASKSVLEIQYPFFVHRTKSNTLPIYTDIRNQGSRVLTIVRKVEGDINALCNELRQDFPEDRIWINQLTRHIVFKGRRVHELRQWFTDRGF